VPQEVREVGGSDDTISTYTKGGTMDDVVAYKLTGMRGGQAAIVQYVSPDAARYASKLLWEEGYEDVVDEALTQLPEGVTLDVN